MNGDIAFLREVIIDEILCGGGKIFEAINFVFFASLQKPIKPHFLTAPNMGNGINKSTIY